SRGCSCDALSTETIESALYRADAGRPLPRLERGLARDPCLRGCKAGDMWRGILRASTSALRPPRIHFRASTIGRAGYTPCLLPGTADSNEKRHRPGTRGVAPRGRKRIAPGAVSACQ